MLTIAKEHCRLMMDTIINVAILRLAKQKTKQCCSWKSSYDTNHHHDKTCFLTSDY